jgi:hypothetical protein
VDRVLDPDAAASSLRGEGRAQSIQHPGEVFAGDDQGRHQPDDEVVRLLAQQAEFRAGQWFSRVYWTSATLPSTKTTFMSL